MTASRIDVLSAEQAMQMDDWADRWTAVGLRTGGADRAAFETAARRAYVLAGLPWPGKVAWVSSPLELALGATVAALTLRLQRHDLLNDHVRVAILMVTASATGAVVGRNPWGGLHPTLDRTLDQVVGDALKIAPGWDPFSPAPLLPTTRADLLAEVMQDAVSTEIHDTLYLQVAHALQFAVSPVAADLVNATVGDVVDGAVGRAQRLAGTDTLRFPRSNPPGVALHDAVQIAMTQAECGALRSGETTLAGDVCIRETMAHALRTTWRPYREGQFGVGGRQASPAVTSFYRQVCGLQLPGDLWERAQVLEALAESAAWWYPHRQFVLACERPAEFHRESAQLRARRGLGSHRLHASSGPALAWPDGWGVHALHGQLVPFWLRHLVDGSAGLTPEEIATERDPALVRLMVDHEAERRYSEAVARNARHQATRAAAKSKGPPEGGP